MTMRVRAILVSVLALTITACGHDLSVRTPDRTRVARPGTETGGTLTIGITAPASIDPGDAWDHAGGLVTSLTCEPLIRLDPVTGAISHGIVDAVGRAAEGQAFTLRLHRGVRFQDGSPVTAQDVAYTLARVARQDYASTFASLLGPVEGYAKVHAAQDPTDTTEPAKRELSGVRVISAEALTITLTAANADFLRALSLPFSAPVPAGLPDRDSGFAARPVCAGPYSMVRPYRRGDTEIELHRFAGYYGSDAAHTDGGRGYPDRVVFRIEPDGASLVRDYQAGAIDIARLPTDTDVPAGAGLLTSPTSEVEFAGVLGPAAPLADPATRVTLSRALDRSRLAADVFGGRAAPASRILPPALATGDPPPACRRSIPATPATDPAAAARLRGLKLRYVVNDDLHNRALADAVARQWRDALGIDVEVVAEPWAKYLKDAQRGVEGAFRESWSPASPSADAFLAPLFHSATIGNTNFARYANADFDRRLTLVADRQVDDAVRALEYRSLEEMICTDLPLIPLLVAQDQYLVRQDRIDTAGSWFFDLSSGEPDLREIYVRRVAG